QAIAGGRPYALAFVDGWAPPGCDGIHTVWRIWDADPSLQVVFCTSYSDFAWCEAVAARGQSDRFVIVRKPFDPLEVGQLARALPARSHDLELANRALREETAQREALAADACRKSKLEALGRLAAGIAHEINNPAQWATLSLKFVRRALPGF